ncbi:MAG: hypothetical protein H7122_17965 [Chitinophagaceae bacterium]|nr:hypothetical protein [Chitinophagaceae bacterium]
MKQFSAFAMTVIVSLMLFSCSGSAHDEAEQLADQIKETTKKNSPGTVATSESNYYMKAKIDGKNWVASHMMPDEEVNSSYIRIHGENGGDYMNFQLWKRGIESGKKFPFDDEHAANLSLEDDDGFWAGKSGELEITKLDGKWMEGKFWYKATSSGSTKTVEVTEGFFRVPFVLNPKQ